MANDLDMPEPDVLASDLEGQGRRVLERNRGIYYSNSRTYRESCPGGPYYKTLLEAYGPKTADAHYQNNKAIFEQYLAGAMLTEDGQTTNPNYPTDRMIARERRRLRSVIFTNTDHYLHFLGEHLPMNVHDWNVGMLQYYFDMFPRRHYDSFYEQIMNMGLVCNQRAKSMYEVGVYLLDLAVDVMARIEAFPDLDSIFPKDSYVDTRKENADRDEIREYIRKSLINYMLGELPYINPTLEVKTDLAPNTIGKEVVEEEKPVFH